MVGEALATALSAAWAALWAVSTAEASADINLHTAAESVSTAIAVDIAAFVVMPSDGLNAAIEQAVEHAAVHKDSSLDAGSWAGFGTARMGCLDFDLSAVAMELWFLGLTFMALGQLDRASGQSCRNLGSLERSTPTFEAVSGDGSCQSREKADPAQDQ